MGATPVFIFMWRNKRGVCLWSTRVRLHENENKNGGNPVFIFITKLKEMVVIKNHSHVCFIK